VLLTAYCLLSAVQTETFLTKCVIAMWMKELNFLDVRFLVQELQQCVNARLQKVYDEGGLLLVVYLSSVGKFMIRVKEDLIWLTAYKPEAGEKLSGLCQSLRKRIVGKKLTMIEQIGSERIVKFTWQTKDELFFLFVELFGNGNIILTDNDQKVLAAREERAWKDREIRRGKQYVLPPEQRNLFKLEASEIRDDERYLAKFGFGSLLAKEIIARGGNYQAYQSLIDEKFSPIKYGDGLVSPIKLEQYKELGAPAESFSSLIDSSFEFVPKKEVKQLSAFDKKNAKLSDVIKKQSATVNKLKEEAADCQVKGDFMYEHFQELQELLDHLKKGKEKMSLQDMKDKLKGHKVIKDIDPKTNDVIVEL